MEIAVTTLITTCVFASSAYAGKAEADYGIENQIRCGLYKRMLPKFIPTYLEANE
ncbi:MAG: hypothetical protein ACI9LX_002937 [Paraglaciecola sp.]|jgi:hypothetical protein